MRRKPLYCVSDPCKFLAVSCFGTEWCYDAAVCPDVALARGPPNRDSQPGKISKVF